MSQPFLKIPFASSGDVTTIPSTVQPSGAVSYPEGFGPDYQLSNSDVGVLYPERPVMNELFNVIMTAVQYLQVHGFPDFITTSDNGGSPYSYDKNSCVRYSDGIVYYSLVDTNTALPSDATKWAPLFPTPAFKTGMMIFYEDITLPDTTWIWANGTTVGDASSNATGRANADTLAHFTQIWNSFSNTVRPIVNSNGSPGTRGVSAAADFAAHKALPVRDMRDVTPAGWGTMGGTSDRGLLTAANTLGVDGSVLGATGGEQRHTPTIAEMAAHTHAGSSLIVSTVGNHIHTVPGTTNDSGGSNIANRSGGGTAVNTDTSAAGAHTHTISGSTNSQGTGTAFNVVQPTTICNFIIKL